MKTNWGTGDLVLCLIRVQGIGSVVCLVRVLEIGSVGCLGYWRLDPSFGQGTGDWVRHLVRLLEIGSFGFEPAKVRDPRYVGSPMYRVFGCFLEFFHSRTP
jgi:hypothetical protein